jgi:hypothetical protein
VLGSRGFDVRPSSALHANATNIIIDEFTNYIENRRIAVFRKDNPNNRCVFVLTEFAERKYGIESLNHFGGIVDAALIALFNVYLRLSRDDFPSARRVDFATLFMHSPVLALYLPMFCAKCIALGLLSKNAINPSGDFLRTHHRLIYFHMRYLGLKAHLQYADAVISSHELIVKGFAQDLGADGQKLTFLGVIYPEFNKQRVLKALVTGKKLYLEITGSVTRYRQKWINWLNGRINVLGIRNVFGLCAAIPFSLPAADKPANRAAYSLHPPQTRNWKYCSPTRIYRALEIDKSLPVLTKNFSQNPIEDVCFLLKDQDSLVELADLFFNREALLDLTGRRIETYNGIAKQRNDKLVQSLKTNGADRC